METINPLVAVEVEEGNGDLPAEGSFVTAPGVLTTLKQADEDKGKHIVMRLFNNTSKSLNCQIGGLLGLKPQCELDLEENELSEFNGRLEPYEIKTLRMKE